MLFGIGLSCRILYSIVSYLYVSHSGSFTRTLVDEQRAKFFCYRLLVIMWFLFGGRCPLPLGAWDGLRYFNMAIPGPSI